MNPSRILRVILCPRIAWIGLLLAVTFHDPALAVEQATPFSGAFNVEAETKAYLERQTAKEKTQSDAYFEGGYWVQLWQFLYGAALSLLLLQTRLSAGMRDLARRLSRFKPVQSIAYAIQYILLTSLITFPLSVYTDFLREHQYGLATQNFAGWLGDWLKGLMVGVIIGCIAMVGLVGVVRRLH